MSFSSLGLSETLVRAVADAGYDKPTPIQTQAIPAVLAGRDLMAGAQTGTGKTAGFVLPILHRLEATQTVVKGPRPIRVLILTPTRELAAQVEESVRTYGIHSKIKSTVVFGGVSINPQIDAIRRGVDILVATPGRLLDHHGQRTVDLSKVEVLVLDEADRMLDMGFLPDIKRIINTLPKRRQNLLFSATFADEIKTLAQSMLNDPLHVQATPRNSTVEAVAQKVLPVEQKKKAALLLHLVRTHNWFQVLVFTRTKHGANKLALQLDKNGVPALAIHGNKSQGARTRALTEFKSGKLQVLVATDIAARGLDIDDLPHVVNFDLPNVPEDYVHRIGRTGRAGATGEAVSLVSPEERVLLRDIERVIKRQIPTEVIKDFPLLSPAHESAGDRPARPPHSQPRAARPQQARRSGEDSKPYSQRPQAPKPQSPRPAGNPHAPRKPLDARSPQDGARRSDPDASRRPAARSRRGPATEANTGARASLPPGWPGTGGRSR